MKRFYYELLLLNLIHTRRRRDSGSKQQSAQRTELGRRDWDEGGKGSRGGGLVVLPGPPVSKGGPIRDELQFVTTINIVTPYISPYGYPIYFPIWLPQQCSWWTKNGGGDKKVFFTNVLIPS